MGSLVDQDAAAFAAPGCAPVGLTVVGVGTPPGVDDPVGTTDLAQLAGLDDLTDLLVQLVGSLVEHDAQLDFGMSSCAVQHLLNVGSADASGLLADDMHAVLQSVDSHFVVQVVGNGGDDGINVTGSDHFLVVLVNGNFGELSLDSLALSGVDVTDSAQFAVRGNCCGGEAGESGGAGQDVAVRAALCAEADDAITNLVHVACLLNKK